MCICSSRCKKLLIDLATFVTRADNQRIKQIGSKDRNQKLFEIKRIKNVGEYFPFVKSDASSSSNASIAQSNPSSVHQNVSSPEKNSKRQRLDEVEDNVHQNASSSAGKNSKRQRMEKADINDDIVEIEDVCLTALKNLDPVVVDDAAGNKIYFSTFFERKTSTENYFNF